MKSDNMCLFTFWLLAAVLTLKRAIVTYGTYRENHEPGIKHQDRTLVTFLWFTVVCSPISGKWPWSLQSVMISYVSESNICRFLWLLNIKIQGYWSATGAWCDRFLNIQLRLNNGRIQLNYTSMKIDLEFRKKCQQNNCRPLYTGALWQIDRIRYFDWLSQFNLGLNCRNINDTVMGIISKNQVFL